MTKKKIEQPEVTTEENWHYRYPVGFFMARRAIKDLEKYRSLIWHNYNYAGDVTNNPELIPLEKLIKNSDPVRRHELLRREIDKSIAVIVRRFDYVSAPMKYQFSEYGEKKSFDIVIDIFRDYDFMHQTRRDLLIETIHRVMGYYEYSKKSAFRRAFNPLNWIALAINLPIAILRLTGVNVENKKQALFTTGFYRFLWEFY